ncbi:MAG TPA: PRC-barrel domain-containing protein [Acidimicrobiales bacterium]|jgi:uncharacterized protein YrrD
MALLLRATDLIGRVVVTIDTGEDLAEVKDVVYGTGHARLLGFTLRRRGFLGGPMKRVLPFANVAALGRDAVMIESADALAPSADAFAQAVAKATDRNVLDDEVLTESGRRLGKVTDVIVLSEGVPEVVGYEVEAGEAMGPRAGTRVLLPLPSTLAVSGSALVVPAAAEEFVSDDLAGFGASVEAFRARLRDAG